MNILMDGRPLLRPWMGGVPRLAASLANAMKTALGDDQLFIGATGLDAPLATVDLHKKIPNKIVAFLTFTGLSSFDRFFEKQNADVLFLPNLEFVGRPKIPYALLVHDLSFLIEPRWFNIKARIWHTLVKPKTVIKNASHLFAVSQNTKNDLVCLLDIDPNRVTVIPMGLDPLPVLPDAGRVSGAHGRVSGAYDHTPLPRGSRYILCLGGSNLRKNASCVAAAHAELIKNSKYADVKLVMIGVQGTPRLTDHELFTLMRDASIFCYPSWYEGFGMPLHEAARFGTPCIASTASSLPEIAPEGTTFASPAKPHHWVEAMCQTLDNPKKYRTQTVLSDWEKAGEMIIEKLRTIAKPSFLAM